MYFDRSLRFTKHIAHVAGMLNKFSGLIYKVRHLYPIICSMFYHSYSRFIITYGLLVYGSAAKTNIVLIEKAQRRILRATYTESFPSVLTKYQILTASELYISELIHDLLL